jgi:prepilin-type N-terminal cleavage/methylation domain-containing protein/prepilin-type processing-associated H-X9-DG protein
MPDSPITSTRRTKAAGFTLIELLVVISIISLLISILMPSLGRARAQAKSVHCLARLKEFGNALATYENAHGGVLPPALWYPDPAELNDPHWPPIEPDRPIEFGWTEILFHHVYDEKVRIPQSYVVQRNIDGRRWQEYFTCNAVGDEGVSSGHYRVYLPAWAAGTYALESDGVYGLSTRASPTAAAQRERIRPKMPIIGDANEWSERGDGFGDNDCSYIDAGEANYAGSDGAINGNRFSDRHFGGTNYLFADLHAAWDARLRSELARDYDLNGVIDVAIAPQP